MNIHRPHVFVLPEDQANTDIINGFLTDPFIDSRRIQALPNAGGYKKLCEQFKDDLYVGLKKNADRFIILVVDFDEKDGRFAYVKSYIPADVQDRVFIIGAKSEPEDLKKRKIGFGDKLEEIGKNLAKDCRESTSETWSHELLKHNLGELSRMNQSIRDILFHQDLL